MEVLVREDFQSEDDLVAVLHLRYHARGANMNDIGRRLSSAAKTSGVDWVDFRFARGLSVPRPDLEDAAAPTEPDDPDPVPEPAPVTDELRTFHSSVRDEVSVGPGGLTPLAQLFAEGKDGPVVGRTVAEGFRGFEQDPPRTEAERDEGIDAMLSAARGTVAGKAGAERFVLLFRSWSEPPYTQQWVVLHSFDRKGSLTEVAPIVVDEDGRRSLGQWQSSSAGRFSVLRQTFAQKG